MNLSVNELCELVTALNQSDIAELTFKNAEFELTLRKSAAIQSAATLNSAPAAALPVAPAIATSSHPPAVPAAAPPPPPPAPTIDTALLVEITAPMVGTFYRSPTPDEAAFVEVGDRIQSGQTVCIIEAMKLMNELESEISGEIVDILVENAEPIEFGQPLMRVRPAK